MVLRPLIAMLAALLLTGCWAFDLGDTKAEHDDYVEESIRVTEQRKAVDFLSSGGVYFDADDDVIKADQEIVLPLCQRLQSEFKLEPLILVETDDEQEYAYDLVVKVPADAVVRNSIQTAIQEADSRFEGSIETEWGHKWLSITLYGPDELE